MAHIERITDVPEQMVTTIRQRMEQPGGVDGYHHSDQRDRGQQANALTPIFMAHGTMDPVVAVMS